MAAAFFGPVLLVLPFANRAYHIDDPMFVRVAQHIVDSPLDYFGSVVDRGTYDVPMYLFNQNPPGFSYCLAVVGAIAGWGEVPMHFVSAFFAGLTGLGAYVLAARLCSRPGFATALTVFTPGFLVSATTVMTDLPMVALYVWAIYLWIVGLDRGGMRWLVASVAAITFGTFLKYYAITAIPLLLVYTLMRERRADLRCLILGIPVLATALFLWVAYLQYDVNLLSVASEVALDNSVRNTGQPLARLVITLGFAGGCFLPLAFYVPSILRPRVWVSVITVIGVASLPLIGGYSILQLLIGDSEPFGAGVGVHLGVMVAAGSLVSLLVIQRLREAWGADSVLLVLWVLGALVFTERVNHLINARALLPLLPAAAILVAQRLPDAERIQTWAPIVPAALLTLWVCAGDYATASRARESADRAAALASAEGAAMYHTGLWGLPYYLEEHGFSYFPVEVSEEDGSATVLMNPGELIAVTSEGRENWRTPPREIVEATLFSYPNCVFAATYHPVSEAGFYSHLTGLVPYWLGPTPAEEYGVYRWLGAAESEEDSGDE